MEVIERVIKKFKLNVRATVYTSLWLNEKNYNDRLPMSEYNLKIPLEDGTCTFCHHKKQPTLKIEVRA